MRKTWWKRWLCMAAVLVLCMTGCDTGTDVSSGTSGDTQPTESAVSAPINEGVAPQGLKLTVDTDTTYQHIKGYGASGCWWAATWKTQYTEAVIDEAVNYLYNQTEGIGLNYYRYNVGGGTTGAVSQAKRETYCIEVSPGVYDLSRDASNIAVLDKVLALGATDVTLFMNSPPARMTVSGDTQGNPDGSCNLKTECFDEYVEYVTGVTKTFLDAGYPITYVSPINEPQWAWNEGIQEGCHFSVEQMIGIDLSVIDAFKAAGITAKISMPETAAWYDKNYTQNVFSLMVGDPDIRAAVDHFSGHSYGSDAGTKRSLRSYFDRLDKTLPVHQTEWAQTSGSGGITMKGALDDARVLHEDLALLNVELWEFWLGVEGATSWPGGLVYLQSIAGPVQPAKRMWILGNYSRFTKGATRVDLAVGEVLNPSYGTTGDPNKVFGTAYVSADGTQTIVVMTNVSDEEQPVCFSGVDGKMAQAYETSTLKNLECVGQVDPAYGYVLPACSVTTFVFS